MQHACHNTLTPADVWAVRAIDGSSFTALAFFIWEMIITFDSEVKYIWQNRGPRTSPVMKGMYLFIRYFALMIHLTHRAISWHSLTPSDFTIPLCKARFIFEILTAVFLMTAVEGLLMIRVYVLYDCDRSMKLILIALVFMDISAMVSILVFMLPDLIFSPVCVVTVPPRTMFYFYLASLFSQSIVLGFTAYKGWRAIVAGWGRTPLTMLVVHDGAWTFVGLFAVMIGNAIVYQTVDKSLSSLGNYWVISIMSAAGCRIIINMQELGATIISGGNDRSLGGNDSRFELTTFFNMDSGAEWVSLPPAAQPDGESAAC